MYVCICMYVCMYRYIYRDVRNEQVNWFKADKSGKKDTSAYNVILKIRNTHPTYNLLSEREIYCIYQRDITQAIYHTHIYMYVCTYICVCVWVCCTCET